MQLTTKRLVLRGPAPDDLEHMFAIYRDPVAMRYWSTLPHDNVDVTRDLLNRRIAAWKTAPVNFQITLAGRYIGNAGNYQNDEVGFMLSPAHWRQGILTEAMGAIIPYLWQATAHTRLTADVDPNNAGSCGLLRKLGFQETHRVQRTYCIGGIWSDSVYFALQRPS